MEVPVESDRVRVVLEARVVVQQWRMLEERKDYMHLDPLWLEPGASAEVQDFAKELVVAVVPYKVHLDAISAGAVHGRDLRAAGRTSGLLVDRVVCKLPICHLFRP